MSAFANRISAQLLQSHISLFACTARMQAQTDTEALHDLRINLRRMRSLLKPLRGLPACDQLQAHAAQVGKLSGPVRDLEVLVLELEAKQQPPEFRARRQQAVQQGYQQIVHSDQLAALLQVLDQWPEGWRAAQRDGSLRNAQRKLEPRLLKAQRKLVDALADPLHDWHDLRLLVKRVRYNAQAYPDVAVLNATTQKALKQVQSALGNWHDLVQWLVLSETEADLTQCVTQWQTELQRAEAKSAEALAGLRLKLINNPS
ncbi:CHAD domain-containing protein [Pseudomonas sp. EL_65y_Pfl2_R95]|uniref:CHAD domain-containing protein n=1 Tax=Pseudomonas sp. EL_65y_Pfl2_R95 TaxID=3088698 RepID=UPI0030DA9AB2